MSVTRFGTLSRETRGHAMKEARRASEDAHDREIAAARAYGQWLAKRFVRAAAATDSRQAYRAAVKVAQAHGFEPEEEGW